MAGGITSAISAAQTTLGAYSRSLAVIQQNIANAATPGYARQRVVLSPMAIPHSEASLGVEAAGIQTLRNGLLDLQVSLARQQKAQLEKTNELFAQLEPSFRLDGGGVNDALDGFFAAASRLSVHPEDANLRGVFRDSAEAFASAARQLYSDVGGQQANLEQEARAIVTRVGALSEQIAQLQASRGGGDARFPNAAIETQLQQKLEELSGLIGFTTQTQNDGALSVIAGSAPVVTGSRWRALGVTADAEGLHVLNDSGQDVTASLEGQGGRLGAILEARNQTLPALGEDLNRLVKSVADEVNLQLARGVDPFGSPGAPLFAYTEAAVLGTGRTAGAAGAAAPAPPPSVTVDFSNGLTGSITASLDGFLVAADPPTGAAAGDRVTVRFVSADGTIDRALTTAPLEGGEDAALLAIRLNDQVALDPELAGLATFSEVGGRLKVVLSDQAGQGFELSAETSNPAFTTGLEAGGALGGQSAEEIAAALNAQVAANAALAAARVRFTALQGELRLDADEAFDYAVADADPAATGFASGLHGAAGRAGGANAAGTIALTNLAPSRIAAGTPDRPGSGDNLLAIEALADRPLIEGRTFNDYFAGIVSSVGQQSEAAIRRLETQTEVTAAAENLRDSLSGVDLNEEAVELMRFEQGYSAMLRVIQTLGQLTDEVLELV